MSASDEDVDSQRNDINAFVRQWNEEPSIAESSLDMRQEESIFIPMRGERDDDLGRVMSASPQLADLLQRSSLGAADDTPVKTDPSARMSSLDLSDLLGDSWNQATKYFNCFSAYNITRLIVSIFRPPRQDSGLQLVGRENQDMEGELADLLDDDWNREER